MLDTQKTEQSGEYSDDDVAFNALSESDLDVLDYSINININGSPKNMIKLGNPNKQYDDENINYSVDFYYCKENDTIHVFRTLKPSPNQSENNEQTHFPSVGYLKFFQKLKGISMMKLVEFNIDEKWVHFEYVPGGTIYDSLKLERELNFGSKFNIFYITAITLNTLHKKGIKHLDIRLESILLTTQQYVPVLADVDMMVHQYKNRESYDDRFLPYLDPSFQNDSNDSVRADIYAYGMVVYLIITKKVQIVEKSNIQNIKNAYSEYKSIETINLTQKLKNYLNKIGVDFNCRFKEPLLNDWLEISRKCLFGELKTFYDVTLALEDYFDMSRKKHLQLKYMLVDDGDSYTKEKFNFDRSSIHEVSVSASNLNSIDVWLHSKVDEINDVPLIFRASEASLYATLSGDSSLYQQILYTDTNSEHK